MNQFHQTSKAGRLCGTDGLTMTLAMLPDEDHREATETLLREQVTLAHKKGSKAWLKATAEKLLTLSYASREWLADHVYRLAKKAVREAKMPESGPSRDIRKKDTPDLDTAGEHLGLYVVIPGSLNCSWALKMRRVYTSSISRLH